MKRPRTDNRDVRGASIQFGPVISLRSPGLPSPSLRKPPPRVRENISLPRSAAMAIPPPPPLPVARRRRRRDTATDSDASARRRSITPSSATPTSRASRLRGNGGATRSVVLSATRVVTPCVVDGSAAQQRSGASLSRAGARRRACDLGHSRWNCLSQTGSAYPETTGKSRVPNREGPTHDMAKVSPSERKG